MWIADKLAYRNQENFIRAYKGDELVWEKYQDNYLTFTANTAGSYLRLTETGSVSYRINLEYSTDGINWNEYYFNSYINLQNKGDYVKFRGNNDSFWEDQYDYCRFQMWGSIYASGSIMSILNSNYETTQMTSRNNHCFQRLFLNCSSLLSAPKLPATTLADYCYSEMFYGCTNLTVSPSLPATTLKPYCYMGMFENCDKLEVAPSLPATTLVEHCYTYMFMYCYRINYIKAMFLTTPGPNYTDNWVNGVSATGTFVKNSNATWDSSGVNSVPTNWTIQYE